MLPFFIAAVVIINLDTHAQTISDTDIVTDLPAGTLLTNMLRWPANSTDAAQTLTVLSTQRVSLYAFCVLRGYC